MRAEAPPRGGSQNSPRGLRHENNTAPTEAELANLQRTLSLNEACGGGGIPAKAEAANFRAGRLRLAQFYELQKPQNDKKRRSNNRPQTTIPYQSSRAITLPADC